MIHVSAVAVAAIWVAANFYLWSMKQSDLMLFWESLVMAAVAFPALYWYVKGPDA